MVAYDTQKPHYLGVPLFRDTEVGWVHSLVTILTYIRAPGLMTDMSPMLAMPMAG